MNTINTIKSDTIKSNDCIKNQSEFLTILKYWIDSCLKNEQHNTEIWLSHQLKQVLPAMKQEEINSIALDIAAYANSIVAAQQDYEQAKSLGMGRAEWFYRKLKKCCEQRSEEDFGQTAGTFANHILSELEKTINRADTRTASGEQLPLTVLTPDVLPPRVGWNEDSIKDRVLDTSKVIDMLSVLGLSRVDDSLIADGPTIHVIQPDKLKEFLLNGDSRLIMAVTGALREAADKKIFNLSALIPANTTVVMPDGVIPSPYLDIPALTGMAANSVEYVRLAQKVLSGEVQAEDALENMVDAATTTAVGIMDVALPNYGAMAGEAVGSFLGKLVAPIFPAAPVIGAKVGGMLGTFVGEQLAQPMRKIFQSIGSTAKAVGRKIVEGMRSAACEAFDGIKSVASKAWSGVKDFASKICSIFS